LSLGDQLDRAEQAWNGIDPGARFAKFPDHNHRGRAMLARLSCTLLLLSFGSAAAPLRTFTIDSSASSVRLHVGKTGLVSFAGHEHEVVARSVEGEIDADFEDLSRSSVEVVVDARSLTVSAEGEPEGDPPQVEQAMKGRQVLDAKRFPDIRFRSQQVTAKGLSPSSYELTVAGDLLLHGTVQPIVVPLRIDLKDDVLTGTGKLILKQTDFGIEPTTAAAGLVKVEDGVTVTFRIVARGKGT
jgi:polyisoprenoid-binding protein YceI